MVDMVDFETTADGSMVKIDMTDLALRVNEPAGRFVGIDQAVEMAAQGLCVIRKKGKGATMIYSSKRMTVEYLERVLVDSYGKYGIYNQQDAELGEKMGKWKIVGPANSAGQTNVYSEEQRQIFRLDEVNKSKTKGVKKRRVAWVQDNFILGGAELSSRLVVEAGIDCGYLIDLLTPSEDSSIMETILTQSDLIVIGNFWGFSEDQTHVVLKSIYSDRKPYIKYEHDHRELDRLEFARRLFQNSRLNIFLSPIHLKNHRDALGCEGIAFPLAIDVDLFKPVEGIERKPNTALVSNVRHLRTWNNLQKYVDEHPEISFTIILNGQTHIAGDNVTSRPMLPYEEMPKLYSEFEYLVHLMDGWGAGERVVFEAALCGCKVVANEMVGHMSWGKNLNDVDDLRDWLTLAPYAFWKEVERRVLYADGV